MATMAKLGKVFGVLASLMLVMVMLALTFANSPQGRTAIERMVALLTANEIVVTGLAGRLPNAVQIGRIELRDSAGVWLSIEQLTLDWSPFRLLAGVAQINQLTAGHISVNRLPPATRQTGSPTAPRLPVTVILNHLQVGRLDLAADLTGKAASIAIAGSGQLNPQNQAGLDLSLQRLDAVGIYTAKGKLDDEGVNAQLSVQEPAQGLLASLAGLQEQHPLSVTAQLAGPLSAVATQFELQSGPLLATAQGLLDFSGDQTDLAVTANATAMRLLPDLSWQALKLDGKLQGPLNQPTINGEFRVDQLTAAKLGIGKTAATLTGNGGQLHLAGELGNIKSATSQTDLLQGTPLTFAADLRLDLPDKPINFKLAHAYLTAIGTAISAGEQKAELAVAITNLKPFAALGGLDVQGKAKLTLNAAWQGDDAQLNADGAIAIIGGNAIAMKLLGDQANIGISANRKGPDLELSRFKLEGKSLTAQAKARVNGQAISGDWQILASDLTAFSANSQGKLTAQGQISGQPDNVNVTAEVNGELGGKLGDRTFPRKPVTAKLQLANLPNAASGQIKANGWLAGSPLDLAIAVTNLSNDIQIALERADWKTAHAQGQLLMPKTAGGFPVGSIALRMTRLADLQPLLDQPLTGAMTATVETSAKNGRPSVRLLANAQTFRFAELASIDKTTLDLTIDDPMQKPRLDGELDLEGLAVRQLDGSLHLALAGTQEALNLQLASHLQTPQHNGLTLNGNAMLDTSKKQLAIAKLQADWDKESLNLLNPSLISFADGIDIDRLRLGIRKAVLTLDGRVTPTLDFTATLEQWPVELAKLVAPDLNATGIINADAKMTGTMAKPIGKINLATVDLRLPNGNGAALPPAELKATADLDGSHANLTGHLNAGQNANLDISGQMPLDPAAPLNLNATGKVDLNLLNPLLNAEGRRIRGLAKLDGKLAGSLSEPLVTGTMQFEKTEFRDYALGVNITAISALVKADNGIINIAKLEGRAGPGSISATGSAKPFAEGLPVDLVITARKARVLGSDQLAVNLNSDLTVRGQALGHLLAVGSVLINSADIRIPEHLPASIAVLKIQTADEPASPPPAKPESKLSLNLVLDAPGKIFVRGRGLDAELFGTVRLHGTAGQPQPDGSFKLRRGEYSLAGKVLTFNQGTVGFNGGSLTDPALNFSSSTSSDNVTATLAIGGTASKPTISLSSVPALPQDEILARLLFKHGTTNLSLVEMVQIGSALASITGVSSGIGDPLAGVRKTLSLDRLSVGTSVEMGRYLIPGIYVGGKKGIIGNSTQATIQIEVTKQLKIEATAGTGTTSGKTLNSNSLGIIYQYEY